MSCSGDIRSRILQWGDRRLLDKPETVVKDRSADIPSVTPESVALSGGAAPRHHSGGMRSRVVENGPPELKAQTFVEAADEEAGPDFKAVA